MWFKLAVIFLLLSVFEIAIKDGGYKYVKDGNSENKDSKLVVTTQGPVRGYRDPKGLFVFYNIPYATAPTGPHKFKEPLPPPTWLEPLEAVDRGIVCPQSGHSIIPHKHNIVEQEDCLIANVYVPDTEKTNLPVVVYIHGGSFRTDFGNILTPKHVVSSKNIIVVTINYRLGVTGFLCLGTKDVPGNAALKDIVAALHWVKKNIGAFAGNPYDVTLAGYSAGAIITDLLTLYPAAAGLFSKVIVDSAVSLISCAIVMDPISNARILAAHLGFNDTMDIKALEDFYKSVSINVLTKQSADYVEGTRGGNLPFAPCIEQGTEDENKKIIINTPIVMIKKRKNKHIPILYGFTNMEYFAYVKNFNRQRKEMMNNNFSELLSITLQFKTMEERENVAHTLKNMYFGDKPINDDTSLEYIEFFGDMFFKIPMFEMIKMRLEAGHKEIYLYEYSFVDENAPFIPHTNTRGAKHNDIAKAVLDDLTNEDNISSDYKKMKSIIREIWANFVKTGSPVPPGSSLPAWPPVGLGITPFMDMTLSPRLVWEVPIPYKRWRLWDSLFERYFFQEPLSLRKQQEEDRT